MWILPLPTMQETLRGHKVDANMEANKNPDHTTEEIYIPELYFGSIR